MSDKQIPTVGRIVHYYSHTFGPDQNNGVGPGPYAAIVTQVIPGGRYVNLRVLLPIGGSFNSTSVEEKPESAGPSDDRYWVWPPRA